MKLIRNRKMLQAMRSRYSHLMQSLNATIHECAQEMATRDAMIEWLARELADRTEVCTDCPAYIGERCMEPTKRCYKAWITEAEKAVQDADSR